MKVLCFSPNDAIWLWAFPQALALEALKQQGHEVVYVACEREFSSYCMSMAASGVAHDASPAEKERICNKCVHQSRMIRREFSFRGVDIGGDISSDMRAQAEALAADRPLAELIDHEYLDVPVGRLALYETIVQNKLADTDLKGAAERFYRKIFRNTYVATAGLSAILQRERPDVCITYHSVYAYNRAFQLLAERRDCRMYFVNAGFNVSKQFRHLIVAKSDTEDLFRRLLTSWPRFAQVPCPPERLSSVTDHMIGMMRGGGFAYSVALDRREDPITRLRVPQGRKLLLATLSSYDELLAADKAGFGWSTRNDVFASQIEWVRWLFDFMPRHPELHLIVRVHPREFQVQGKGVRSQHSYLLEEAFRDPPSNVSINWPSDRIPFYQLLFQVDAVLNAWSTAGMEAGMLGIPVVTYSGDVLLFPRELTFDVARREDYEPSIHAALDAGWSLERSRAFYRWAALMLEGVAAGLADAVPDAASVKRGIGRRIVNRVMQSVLPGREELRQVRARPERLREADRIVALVEQGLPAFYELANPGVGTHTLDSETDALRREMRRIASHVASATGTTPARMQMYLDAQLT